MNTRLMYIAAVITSVILGLSSRMFSGLMPVFISKHSGDALWASMIYFGFRFLFMKRSLKWTAAASVTFCFIIEFSQLYKAEWIMELRNTTIGALVLGRGFLTVDLIRYVAGVIIACGVDKYWLTATYKKKGS